MQAPELVELGGTALEGLLFTSYFRAGMFDTELGKKFRSMYERQRGSEPLTGQSMGAEAYFMVLDAIRRAGSGDPARIREALERVNPFEGVMSKSSIKADGTSHPSVCIKEVRNGRFICAAGADGCSVNRNSETLSHRDSDQY